MLAFLRKIRRSLLESGGYKKYLAYSIGEIALVVVGILIALQINNWREAGRNAQWEKYYVTRLVDDFQHDLSEIDETAQSAYRRIVFGNTILTRFGEDYLSEISENILESSAGFLSETKEKYLAKDSLQLLSFAEKLPILTRYRGMDLRSYTYTELLSNGRFEMIANDKLRELISDYYWVADDLMSIEQFLRDAHAAYVDFITNENVPIANTISFAEFEDLIQDRKGYQTVLKNLIYSHIFIHWVYNDRVKKKAEPLLAELKAYLDTL